MLPLLQTECEIIFVEWSLYDTIKDTVLSKCPHLKHIIVIGEALVPTSVIGGTLAELKCALSPAHPKPAARTPAAACRRLPTAVDPCPRRAGSNLPAPWGSAPPC